jgi:hypothetical protein
MDFIKGRKCKRDVKVHPIDLTLYKLTVDGEKPLHAAYVERHLLGDKA